MSPWFLYYFFNSDHYWIQIAQNKGNNLKGGMNGSILGSLVHPMPPLDEQNEIASILQIIDQDIECVEKKKASFQNIFKSMLNLLMTGKVRVKDLEVPADAFD